MGRMHGDDVVALLLRPESNPPQYYLVMPLNRMDKSSWVSILRGINLRLQHMTNCLNTLTLRISNAGQLPSDTWDVIHQYTRTQDRMSIPVLRLRDWYQELCRRPLVASVIKIIEIESLDAQSQSRLPARWESATAIKPECNGGWELFESLQTIYIPNAQIDMQARNLFRHVSCVTCPPPLLRLFGRSKPLRNIVFQPLEHDHVHQTNIEAFRAQIFRALPVVTVDNTMGQCVSSNRNDL